MDKCTFHVSGDRARYPDRSIFYATNNQHVKKCKYEIDYGLVRSYKVL